MDRRRLDSFTGNASDVGRYINIYRYIKTIDRETIVDNEMAEKSTVYTTLPKKKDLMNIDEINMGIDRSFRGNRSS